MFAARHGIQAKRHSEPARRGSESSPSLGMFRSDFLFGLADTLFERLRRKVRLLLVNQERRRQAQRILAGTQHQQPFAESKFDNQVSQVPGAFFGTLIAYKLDADHQSLATDVSDDLELLGPTCRAPKDVIAHPTSV